MKYCTSCGEPMSDDARFCSSCGAAVEEAAPAEAVIPAEEAAPAEEAGIAPAEEAAPAPAKKRPSGKKKAAPAPVEGKQLSETLALCTDGKYRWIYELPMMKNLTILFTVLKVLAIAGCAPLLIVLIADRFRNILGALEVYLLVCAIFFVLSLIAYTIVAAMNGWKYIVIFEMDEDGVLHAQQQKQFKKAQALMLLTALAGISAGNPTTAGAGLLAATRSSMYSSFASVKKVRCVRRRNVIYVNETLSRNQVYAYDEDFDFIADYIKEHCREAKIDG